MSDPLFQIRLLGTLTVLKSGVEQRLPASRKVRALLAFLAVSPIAVPRVRLCELLWDLPDDPRGELRWALSKLRRVLEDEDHGRIDTSGDAVALNLTDCAVDVVTIGAQIQPGLDRLDAASLSALHDLFIGEFAAGLEVDGNPQFASWLNAQRRRFRTLHVSVLEQLVTRLAGDVAASIEYLEKWLQVSPFDERAHRLLLNALLQGGRIREADEHLATTIRLFEAEGVDWMAIRESYRAARQQLAQMPSIESIAPTPRSIEAPIAADNAPAARRASICVMPFVDRTAEGNSRSVLATGLTDDVITHLAKLRAFCVIARGSVFALNDRSIPPEEAARLLNVDYVASGSVRRNLERVEVAVELVEAKTARVMWVEDFSYKLDDALSVLDDITKRIVGAIANEIEMAERNRAMLKPPSSLNAWEAYHRGLWHMYRFSDEDNGYAAHFFRMALDQDRTFARAYAGLSFTHFQNAFLHRTVDRRKEIDSAYEMAGQSLIADDRDPAAHWAMGRALWLRGSQQDSVLELETCVRLSPNFALGHYTLGFVHSQSGDPQAAIASTDYSRYLSPFDPLQFAMWATRAIALARLGRYHEAADSATKGAARPNAHVHIHAVAACCLAAAGRCDDARTFVVSLRKLDPDYELDDFFSAFRFGSDATAMFRQNAALIGFDD